MARKKLARNGSILQMADIQAVQSSGDGLYALPWCTVVTDQYDPSIGGATSDPV